MADEDLKTLPGTIEGLIQPGGLWNIHIGDEVVKARVLGPDDRPEDQRHGPWECASSEGEWPDVPEVYQMSRSCRPEEMTLEMSDKTSRCHAAWYCLNRWLWHGLLMEEYNVSSAVCQSIRGADLSKDQEQGLTCLVLHIHYAIEQAKKEA